MKTFCIRRLVIGLFYFTLAHSCFSSTADSLRLWVQNGYLPSNPVLVRLELLRPDGSRDWNAWDADGILSANNGITLSTNRITLRNGLGSALVSFSGAGDFSLTASVGALQTNRVIRSLTAAPVTALGGTLTGTTSFWTGTIRITNDLVVPSGHTLTIGSNTLVLLDPGSVDIFVNGSIQSLGTELAPITSTCTSNNRRWGQIRLTNAAPSLFRHTSVTRGGTGPAEGHTATCPVFRPLNSKLVFESCSITDHAEVRRGAAGFGTPGKAMYAIGSNLSFDDCLLQRCRMGPEIEGTALILTNSYILDMFGPDDADGIYLHSGNSMTIDRCVIAYGDDDGIDTLGANVSVANTIIRNWSNLGEDAKGISIFSGEARIRRCLIVDSTVSVSAKTNPGESARVSINDSTITGISNSVWAA